MATDKNELITRSLLDWADSQGLLRKKPDVLLDMYDRYLYDKYLDEIPPKLTELRKRGNGVDY